MALLYNEMKNTVKAEESLAKALALKSQNPRVYYNYGLMMQKNGNTKKALAMLEKGLELSSLDADLNYVLCGLHLRLNQIDKTKQCAGILKKYYSGMQSTIGLSNK